MRNSEVKNRQEQTEIDRNRLDYISDIESYCSIIMASCRNSYIR